MKIIVIFLLLILPMSSKQQQLEKVEPTYRVQIKLNALNNDINQLIHEVNNANI